MQVFISQISVIFLQLSIFAQKCHFGPKNKILPKIAIFTLFNKINH